jgi:archaemetzincin
VAAPIHLVWVDGGAPPWLDALTSGLEAVFPNPVRLLPERVDLEPCFVPGREQHHATLVLAALLRHRPAQPAGGRILGLVGVDLFIPVLTFVFGQAQLDGPAAVVSTYRLRPSFYGLPPDEGMLLERAIKECVHELGHAFGLVHCETYDCVMHASMSVDEVDLKDSGFCRGCLARLEARGWR